jgi:hypothetical protein
MRLIAAMVLALTLQEAPSLKPLTEVAKRLDEGIKAFIDGKDMKESFKEWDAGETSENVVIKLREDLEKDHVVSAKMFAMELRLVFYSAGSQVFDVSALVQATAAETGILAIKGRKSTGTGKVGLPIEKCDKDARPIGAAAQALLNFLKGEKGADLPFVELKKVSPLVPKVFGEQLKSHLEKAKDEAEALRKELGDLKYDEVKVQLDEQYFTPFGAEGLKREAFIRGKLRFNPSGEVTFRLSRYETK